MREKDQCHWWCDPCIMLIDDFDKCASFVCSLKQRDENADVDGFVVGVFVASKKRERPWQQQLVVSTDCWTGMSQLVVCDGVNWDVTAFWRTQEICLEDGEGYPRKLSGASAEIRVRYLRTEVRVLHMGQSAWRCLCFRIHTLRFVVSGDVICVLHCDYVLITGRLELASKDTFFTIRICPPPSPP